MALLKNILWTIGGPEAPAGTAAALTHVLPVRDNPGLTQRAERGVDPAIVGARMDISEFPMKLDVAGGLPLAPRVGGAIGKLLKSCLGTEGSPTQIGACIRIRYTGASASCKITGDASSDELNSKVGSLGSESNDAGFGTTGTIDLTNAATDTVGELVNVIDGYANYEAELVTGASSVPASDIVQIVTQAADRWCYIFFTKATGGAYLRTYTADLTDTEHPAYTIQGEGYIANGLEYSGCVVNSLKFSGALGSFLNMDADILGFIEDASASASGLTVDDVDPGDPLIWQLGAFELGGKDYPFISTSNFSIDNQNNKETYGQGSLGRQYHQKSMLKIIGDAQIRLDADTYALRADIFTSTLRAISMIFRGKVLANSVEEIIIVELPFVMISNPYDFTPRNGAFDAKINWAAKNPRGTKYDVPIKIHMISPDSGAF